MLKTIQVIEDPETGQRAVSMHEPPFYTAKLIVTHDGLMHADEVFAIALIHVFLSEIPVLRTRQLHKETFEDKDIILLDQGGKLEPELSNFDHHHLKSAAQRATVALVFDYLVEKKAISEEEAAALRPAIDAISKYDINGPFEFNGFQFNEYIKSLNTLSDDEGGNFTVGVEAAKLYILSKVRLVNVEGPESETIWINGFSPSENIRICKAFPIFWKTYNKEKWLIVPDKVRKDQWILHAYDSRTNPIKPTGKEVFIHENAFIAAYSSSVDAVEAAKQSQACWKEPSSGSDKSGK